MSRALLVVLLAVAVALPARADEPAATSAPAAQATVDDDARTWAAVGLGLLAGGAAVAAGTMTAYQLLTADPSLVNDEPYWLFDEDGPTRQQVAGALGVSGGAAGAAMFLVGAALIVANATSLQAAAPKDE